MSHAANDQRKAPTLNDVARHAAVSKQTISRVINNKDDVAPATRQRVLDAIREVGYQPNTLARSLVTRKTTVIGLSVPNIDQPFFPQIARGVEDAAHEHGYSVFLCNVGGDPEREMHALERMRGHRVAGVISFSSHMTDVMIEQVTGGFFPVMLINREISETRGTIIWPGYEEGARIATQHLIDLGRRSIAFLGVDQDSNVDIDKFHGFQQALADAGIEHVEDLVVRPRTPSGRTFHDLTESGSVAIERLRERNVTFDGVVASNDLLAIGTMHRLIACGSNIPDDVAVIGFGGSDVASIVTPRLSTVSMPLYEMGVAAFQSLHEEIHGQSSAVREVETRPALITRKSTLGYDPADS